MSPRSLEEKRRSFGHIVGVLESLYPNAHIELNYTNPLELLVAVVLSAQCTDARVNMATPGLFARFRSARDYADSSPTEVEPFIKTLGLFRAKARALVGLGQQLVAEYSGVVPSRRDALATLPGVGLKTAGVVSAHLGGDPAFPVDTHVFRLAHRLGLSKGKTPDAVEKDLQRLSDSSQWMAAHQLLIWHGRRMCLAQNPKCTECPLEPSCPQKGVKAPRPLPTSQAARS